MFNSTWWGRYSLGLTASLFFLGHGLQAQADPDAVLPYTGSELPIMGVTPGLIYGTYGPQTLLDAETFESIPEPIYLSKELEAQLAKGTISVEGVNIETTAVMSDDATPYDPKRANKSGPRTLTLEDVKTLAKEALLRGQDNGLLYDAAVALKDNHLVITLTPLSVESVVVDAENHWQGHALEHLTRGIDIDRPLDLPEVQQKLRLIHSNPDIPFKAALEVIPYAHQVKIKLTPEKKSPFHLVASANNLDQIVFGRYFAGLTGVVNNVTGHGDSLYVGAVQGYRSTGGFTRYEFPFTPGFRGFTEFQYADISPYDINYSRFNTHGFAYRITPGVKYVFFDNPKQRMSADFQFDIKQAESASDDDPLEREAVRNFRAGINYDQKWDKTTFSTRHEVAAGFPILGGSLSNDPRLSWFRGGSQYYRYTGFATLLRSMMWDSTASVNVQWQMTPDGTPSFDVGGLGGAFYGRGYREVFLFVDKFGVVQSQWQFPTYFFPKGFKLPFSDKDARDAIQWLVFADYGYGDISAPPDGLDGSDHILSTGVGLRAQLTNRITGRLDLGFPLLRELPYSNHMRLHFGLDAAVF